MTISRKALGDGVVGPEKLSASARHGRYFYEPFTKQPFAWSFVDGFGNPVGTTARVNGLFTGFNTFSYYILGTQTIVMPVLTTDHTYDFGLDQTLADGFELNPSTPLLGSETNATYANPLALKVGTDDGFIRLLFSAEDVSGLDLAVGFRKVQAYATALATYTDFAVIRVLGDSSSATGAITLVTDNDNAGESTTTTTDTLADATAIELEVQLRGSKAKFLKNGGDFTVTNTSFTFDDADVLIPFVYVLQTTDLTGELKFIRMEGGLLEDRPSGALS